MDTFRTDFAEYVNCSDFVTLFPKIRHGRYPVGVVDAIHALWSIVVPYEVRNGWGGSLFPHGVGFVAKTMVVLAGRKPLAVLFKTEFIGSTLSSITVFLFDGGLCEELAHWCSGFDAAFRDFFVGLRLEPIAAVQLEAAAMTWRDFPSDWGP
jgi:hypothetical protein